MYNDDDNNSDNNQMNRSNSQDETSSWPQPTAYQPSNDPAKPTQSYQQPSHSNYQPQPPAYHQPTHQPAQVSHQAWSAPHSSHPPKPVEHHAPVHVPVQSADSGLGLGGQPKWSRNDQPVPVIEVMSTRGVEYTLMMLQVWFGAGALLWLALAIANGAAEFDILAFPIALLLVSLPIFAYLFLRLKKAELADPSLRFDPSKRRVTQLTLVASFSVCFFNAIGLVYTVLQKIGGSDALPLGKTFLNSFIVILIAGGVFTYYWLDEHRDGKR